MSEGGDYYESTWSRSQDFHEARSYYDQNAGRSYTEAKKTGKTNSDLLPKSLESSRRYILAIIGDVTGSMGDAPKIYFSKCAYLLHEVKTEYLGPDTDILMGALGDANEPRPDQYPLQFRPFFQVTAEVEEAKKRIMELITTEKGGGGQQMENYELAAIYLARKVSASKASKKIGVFIGDEAPYETVKKNLASEVALVKLSGDLKTEEIFKELKDQGWDIYMIQRPYDRGCGWNMNFDTARIHSDWVDLLGKDHVAYLPDIDRVVDVMFGILGDATGKYDYFMEEIVERQSKDQGGEQKIEDTFRALGEIHAKHLRANGQDGQAQTNSVLHTPIDGKRGKRLLDD